MDENPETKELPDQAEETTAGADDRQKHLRKIKRWSVLALFIAFLAIPMHLISAIAAKSADQAVLQTMTLTRSQGDKPLSLRFQVDSMWLGGTAKGEVRTETPGPIEDLSIQLRAPSTDLTLPSTIILAKGTTSKQFEATAEHQQGDNRTRDQIVTVEASAADYTTAYDRVLIRRKQSPDVFHWLNPRGWSPTVWSSIADTCALLSVVWLAALCIFVLIIEPDPVSFRSVPLGLRLACLLSILMALPSSVSNAMVFGSTFWVFISATLIVMGVYILIGHYVLRMLKKYRRRLKHNALYVVVTLISSGGALGGFAYHLISNQYRIELPMVTYLGIHRSAPKEPTPGRIILSEAINPPTGTILSPQHEKSLLLAGNLAEARDRATRSTQPLFLALLVALFTGVLGDVFIGIVAANAAHLLVSGLMYHNYSHDASENRNPPSSAAQKDMSEYQARQRLTVISLGIVAGFAGPRLLPAMAEDLLGKKTQELAGQLNVATGQIETARKEAQEGIEEVKEQVKNLETNPGLDDSKVIKTAQDLMQAYVIPFLKLKENPPPQDAELAAFIKSTSDGKWNTTPAVVAARTFLLTRHPVLRPDPTIVPDATQLQLLIDDAMSNDLKGQIHLLAGRLLLQQRNQQQAVESFKKAMKAVESEPNSQWIIQAASLYLVWIEGPQSTTALTAGVLPSEDLGPLSDQMRITSSLHTETEKEKKVFLATALNDLASWPTHLRLRTAALGGEENKPWIESQNSLVATLKETKDILNAMAASNTADDAHGEAELTQDQKTFLEQLMKEFGAAWDETTLPQKIDLILPILNPPSSPSPAINPSN